MKNNILILFFITITQIVNCQKKANYDISIGIINLSSSLERIEVYERINQKKVHQLSFVDLHNRKKVHKKKLPQNNQIDHAVHELDSLLTLSEYKLDINESIFNTLKEKLIQNENYRLGSDDSIKLFIERSFILELENIPNRIFEGTVVGGTPFKFKFHYFKPKGKIEYSFIGNFSDNVDIKNAKYWIAIYLTNKKYKIFETTTYFDKYFNDENFANVILKYVTLTEK